MRNYLFTFILLATAFGCDEPKFKNSRFKGSWAIEQILTNDFWGGPFYWKDVEWEKEVKFTSNEYFEKTSNGFKLIGSYRILSDNKIQITWNQPTQPEYPTFELEYEFDSEGRLTLHKYQTEGIVSEKYSRI